MGQQTIHNKLSPDKPGLLLNKLVTFGWADQRRRRQRPWRPNSVAVLPVSKCIFLTISKKWLKISPLIFYCRMWGCKIVVG